MEAKHTPGPWRLDDPIHGDVLAIDYHAIDAGPGFHTGREPGFGVMGFMSLADARVMTTAPELLEALREYDEAFTEFDPENRASRHRMRLVVVKARAAIAKATGGAS